MSMKTFDRLLNVALVVTAVIFLVDYFFVRETPGTFDKNQHDFAPVALGQASSSSPVASDAPADAPQASAAEPLAPPPVAEEATGGPEIAEPAPFSALTWEQLEAEVGSDKPTLLVLFASWCPYCKKLIPNIISLANERKDTLNVLAISIDEDPSAIRTYVSTLRPMPSFNVYNNSTDNQRALVQAFLYKNNMQFNGGIPFMGIFKEGKAVQQIGGFVEKSVLTEMLDRIEQQKDVNSKN